MYIYYGFIEVYECVAEELCKVCGCLWLVAEPQRRLSENYIIILTHCLVSIIPATLSSLLSPSFFTHCKRFEPHLWKYCILRRKQIVREPYPARQTLRDASGSKDLSGNFFLFLFLIINCRPRFRHIVREIDAKDNWKRLAVSKYCRFISR